MNDTSCQQENCKSCNSKASWHECRICGNRGCKHEECADFLELNGDKVCIDCDVATL